MCSCEIEKLQMKVHQVLDGLGLVFDQDQVQVVDPIDIPVVLLFADAKVSESDAAVTSALTMPPPLAVDEVECALVPVIGDWIKWWDDSFQVWHHGSFEKPSKHMQECVVARIQHSLCYYTMGGH